MQRMRANESTRNCREGDAQVGDSGRLGRPESHGLCADRLDGLADVLREPLGHGLFVDFAGGDREHLAHSLIG